ncbi:acyl-protein thioesterase 1 [Arctopsyche grandis]|uniref:acyl-protein thioesterase 1 n=1 Tax=Arctopsyche grandis TaxID=121162 RepID=UPI00406D96A9
MSVNWRVCVWSVSVYCVLCSVQCGPVQRIDRNVSMASPVIVAASAKHTATLIFLHGLGDTGHGWASAMGNLRPPHVKVICPTAATMPVTLNAGFRMPSWFDLRTLETTGPEDQEGILRATELIHEMINTEIKAGIPANRIVLGGFSQGGALALHSAMTFPQNIAGVLALSCWMPLHKRFPGDLKATRDLPIIQFHGDCDPVVPYKWGQMTATFLKTVMSNSQFKTYAGMMHTSCDEELKDMKNFVHKLIGSPN